MKLKLTWLLTLFMAFVMQFSFSQEKTVTGTVTTLEDGLPLPGASVIVKGTSRGVQTDFDGKYTVSVNQGDVLVISYVGMKTTEIVIESSSTYDVGLELDSALDEVVVVAYGSTSVKKQVTSVSVISNDDIKDQQNVVVSATDLLQGQASGVQVTGGSGVLGSAPVIRVRGTTTITSGGDPLYVIDGVPLGDDFLTGGQGGTQGLNPLASINPADIETISVLKSASASALYGSRGANGVVLITTKRGGKDGKVSVTLDMNTSFSTITDHLDLMSADQFRAYGVATNQTSSVWTLPGDFDWLDAALRTAVSTNYNLGVSGGTERASYFIGATRADTEGIMNGNELERTSFRANLTSRVNDWLTVGMNTNINVIVQDRVPVENAFASPYTSGSLQRPTIEPRDEDGNFVNDFQVPNIIAQEALNLNKATEQRIIGNFFIGIDLTEHLSFKSDLGFDRRSVEQQERRVELMQAGGLASNSINSQNRRVFTNTLNWERSYGNHNLNALAGIAYEQSDTRGIAVTGTGFLSDDLLNVDSAAEPTTTSSSGSTNRLASQFARVNYDFNSKYLAEVSIRRDGASQFGADQRFGIFWAAALGWNISDESFMQDVSWIQDLKIDVSAGTAGNNRIDDFASLGTLFVSPYNGASGLRPTTLANPDLRWEATTTYDAGISASFFNRRLKVGVEVYKQVTDDLILFVPLESSANLGINGRNENIGELENRGLDLDISGTIIAKEDFTWTAGLNMGFNTNEITSLPESANVDDQGRKFVASAGGRQRAIEGESINTFYLIPFIGINSQTGDAEWLDIDGNATTTPLQSDRRIVGRSNPDFTGGFRTNLKYKNFDVGMLFNFSYGNDIYNQTRNFTENALGSFNKDVNLLNIWQQPGDNAYLPAVDSPTFGTFDQRSTQQLRDASYLRMKNLTIGYTFPFEDQFLKSIRVYSTATNLFTIKSSEMDGYDPEVTRNTSNRDNGEEFFTVPQATTITFGASINF